MSDHDWRSDPGLNVGAQRRLPDFDYSDPDTVMFVTICARLDTVPFTDDRLGERVVESLNWLRTSRGIRIYAFCLMPDHLHLLLHLATTGQTLGHVIGTLKSFTTQQSWKMGYRGQLWQQRFYDHLLRANEDATQIAEYIWQNPVRKGIVTEPEMYRWSGFPDPL